MHIAVGLFGLFCLVAIAIAFSENRKSIQWKLVAWGIGLQFLFAFLVMGVPALGIPGVLQDFFGYANTAIISFLEFTDIGSEFIFGKLTDVKASGFILAFKVLPTIIFMASLMGVLYHIGIMQFIVKWIAWGMQKIMGVSGAESLSVAANIFVGQTEAPLVVKPYVERMTRSELMAVMTGGMATAAGGVLALYVGLLKDKIPDIAGHLLTASIMSAPAALAIAKIIIPEREVPETMGTIPTSSLKSDSNNIIEAAANGASEGLMLALNVAAMLLAFMALIAMVDALLMSFGEWIGFSDWGKDYVPALLAQGKDKVELSFSLILGWVFAPVAWLMGISWDEAGFAGSLLGQKVILNEFVAYSNLSSMMTYLSDRTVIILSYALCGFANFSSIAIQIGGIGGMAPSRRGDLAKLGIRSVIGGSLAAFMTATVAGLLISS